MTMQLIENNIVHTWLLTKPLNFGAIRNKAKAKASGKKNATVHFFLPEKETPFITYHFRSGKLASASMN